MRVMCVKIIKPEAHVESAFVLISAFFFFSPPVQICHDSPGGMFIQPKGRIHKIIWKHNQTVCLLFIVTNTRCLSFSLRYTWVTFGWLARAVATGCSGKIITILLLAEIFVLLLRSVKRGLERRGAISGSVQIQTHLSELLTFISPLSWQPSPVIDNTNTRGKA